MDLNPFSIIGYSLGVFVVFALAGIIIWIAVHFMFTRRFF